MRGFLSLLRWIWGKNLHRIYRFRYEISFPIPVRFGYEKRSFLEVENGNDHREIFSKEERV
jgi:hypothetical protein